MNSRLLRVHVMGAVIIIGSGSFVGSAHAQNSVTMYGQIDDALTYSSNQKGHSNLYLRQGNLYNSKWGIRGSEDLGGGLNVIFDLQNGFDPNNGALGASGLIFNRQAFFGLKSASYGTLTAGRQYTPYYQFVGPLASAAWETGAVGAHPGDIDGLDIVIRANNSLNYTSPVWRGIQASVMYAFSNIAGSMGRGQTFSGALRYNNGPLSLAAGYLQISNAETTETGFDSASSASYLTSAVNAGYLSSKSVRYTSLAGNYNFGSLTAGLNYSNVRYTPDAHSVFTTTAVFNTYAALLAYKFSSTFDVAGSYSYTYASKANGISDPAKYHQIVFRESYHLSRRTTLYAAEGYQHASGKTLGSSGAGNIVSAVASVGDSQDSTPSSGPGQFVGMAGICVSF
ncbi:porin [Paraburkholderia sp. Ac-20347]|uniref:porin n=1 Tax=Paraburkholderia sp. Ac-20347 TaxID=2703892 RepID=UPI001F123936|nr:porin [Paraburkholderia sp. Ac-20347]